MALPLPLVTAAGTSLPPLSIGLAWVPLLSTLQLPLVGVEGVGILLGKQLQ